MRVAPLASVGAVRECLLDGREAALRRLQQRHRPVAILHRGRTDLDDEQPPVRVEHGASEACRQAWRLRPLTFLPASYPRGPPASVVFTLWLSITAADGLASRPDRSRSSMMRWWFTASHTPASRKAANLGAGAAARLAIHGLSGRKARGRHPPRHAAAQHVEDSPRRSRASARSAGVLPARAVAAAVPTPTTRHPSEPARGLDPRVAGTAQAVAVMLCAGGLGPHGSVHPTRSRQPVGNTSSQGHLPPLPRRSETDT